MGVAATDNRQLRGEFPNFDKKCTVVLNRRTTAVDMSFGSTDGVRRSRPDQWDEGDECGHEENDGESGAWGFQSDRAGDRGGDHRDHRGDRGAEAVARGG